MAIEIEHKFLVNKHLWEKVIPNKSYYIKQAYLQTDPERIIRIRTINNHAFITIKGKSSNSIRLEFEYEIPINDANEIIKNLCTNLIEKYRHEVFYEGKKWEIDEFKGLNEGLIIAEIELNNINEKYSIPEWILKNVTDDERYYSSYLAVKPYSMW